MKSAKLLALFAGLLLIIILANHFAPRPLDWTETFSRRDKIPYGSWLVYDRLADLFPDQPIRVVREPLLPFLEQENLYETGKPFNLIFVAHELDLDQYTLSALFDLVAAGSTVFIAAERLGSSLSDSLGLDTHMRFFDYPGMDTDLPGGDSTRFGMADSIPINFVNPKLRREADYNYFNGSVSYYFTKIDSQNCLALGKTDYGDLNFIKMSRGAGNLFISTVPQAFTNINMLDSDKREYIFKALSHLPEQLTYWDEYYKDGRTVAATPLRFILGNDSLRRGYYILVATTLIYMLFHSRRRQRAIPVINPPENSTIQFIKTVGRLYFQHGDHKNLAEKQINHFLDNLRSIYFVKTSTFTTELYEQIAQKSAIPQIDIENTFRYISYILANDTITESQLKKLDRLINEFSKRRR